MISQEQKHSLNVNNPQSKAVTLSENAVPGQLWTTKLKREWIHADCEGRARQGWIR